MRQDFNELASLFATASFRYDQEALVVTKPTEIACTCTEIRQGAQDTLFLDQPAHQITRIDLLLPVGRRELRLFRTQAIRLPPGERIVRRAPTRIKAGDAPLLSCLT